MIHRDFPRLGEAYYEQRLPNGLLVRVVPKKDFARAHAFLAVDYGSIDTRFRRDGEVCVTPNGVAHYLEHKMFDLPEDNAMNLFAALGGSPNAFTSYGMTAYYFDCTDRFADNLRLLLRMVATPCFPEESVEKERGIIEQEIRMYEDSADSRLYEDLFGALFAHHPVRVPIAGTVESISEITAQTLSDCYAAFYTPENMMLCVAGDVDAQEVMDIAAAAFGAASASLPRRDYGEAELLLCAEPRTERAMSVSMPTFAAGFKCAAPQSGFDVMRQELIGDLAADLLISSSAPLYTRLYESGLIDSDFSAGYESVKNACMFTLGGDSKQPEAVFDAIMEEAARLTREGFDRAFFDRQLRSSLGRRMRSLDSFENICYRMCAYHFEGMDYFRFPEVYASVSPEDVQQFLSDVLRPERAAISVILPSGK